MRIKKNIYTIFLIILLAFICVACGKSSIKNRENTTIEFNTNKNETINSISVETTTKNCDTSEHITTENQTIDVHTQENSTKGSTEITKNNEITTVIKQETTTVKKQETTSKKQEANILLGFDENGNPILVTEDEWEYMNSEEYLLENGLSYPRTYTKSSDYEILDYWPEGEYGWEQVDFWWEPVGWNGLLSSFEWGIYCDNYKYKDAQGNAIKYMPSYPSYKESYYLYTGGEFKFSFGSECGKWGRITLYCRKTNEQNQGFGTKCTLINSDEDMLKLLNNAIKSGTTQIAYYYNEKLFNAKDLSYYYGASGILPQYEGVNRSQKINYNGKDYTICINEIPNDNGIIKKCDSFKDLETMEKAIYKYAKVGEWQNYTICLTENIVNAEKIYETLRYNLYHKYNVAISGYSESLNTDDLICYRLDIKVAEVGYDYYYRMYSMEEIKKFILKNTSNNTDTICISFNLKDFLDEGITDIHSLKACIDEFVKDNCIEYVERSWGASWGEGTGEGNLSYQKIIIQ